METQISTLLSIIYTGSNDEIANAESELLESMAHPDFFPSLFNIILNPSNTVKIRKPAIIFLDNSIRSGWDQEDSPINEQVKNDIFLIIPQLLKVSPSELIKISIHLATNVIAKIYLTDEWQDLYEVINNGFLNQPNEEENQITCSLILLGSLFYVSMLINKNIGNNEHEHLASANQNLVDFISQYVVQYISNIIQAQNSNIHILYSYKLINRIFNFNDKMIQQIFDVNELLMPLAQELVQCSFLIKEIPSDDPFFEPFLKRIMKYLVTCASKPQLSNLISIEFIGEILPIAQEIIKSDMKNSIKCITVQFLSKVFANEAVWEEVGETDVANTLVDILSPLFSISSVDYEMAYDDPSSFISENQKICEDEDFNDLKASSSDILYKSAKNHDVLISLCLTNIDESYQLFEGGKIDQLNLFSKFHMWSSVIKLAVDNYNDDILSLFSNMSSLFEISEDENSQFASAAVFFLLASCPNIEYPKELIQAVFSNIDNPFNLARYFAIECISFILRQISYDSNLSSLKEEIFNEFGEKLEQSLQILLSISNEICNENLIESLTHFFSLFGERLLPLAQNLAENFFNMINESINGTEDDGDKSEKMSNLVMTFLSFSSLLKIIVKSEEISSQLCPLIYENLIQLFPSIPKSILESYFSMLNQIVLDSPLFDRSYWSVTEIFNNEIASEFNQLIELIQFRDLEMSSDENAVQFMISFISDALNEMTEYEDFDVYCPSIIGFVLRISQTVVELNDGELFSMIVQKIIPFIQFLCSEEVNENEDEISNNNIVRLLNALFIADADSLAENCGEDFPQIFSYWEQRLIYPLSIPAIVNALLLKFLDDVQKSTLLSSALNLACENLNTKNSQQNQNEEEEDENESDSDLDDIDDVEKATENCPWFNDQEVASMLSQIFSSYHPDSSLCEKCNPEQVEFIMQYPNNH